MTSSQLRKKFLEFFDKRGHTVIPSAPLVPSEEEQLFGKEKVLFTSAGMQPLIPYLSGQKEPPAKRLADSQKCLRTDDIEEVGDLIHHTFFEMLGNWSIGDYWKKEAIELSFRFLTEELNIPKEKLFISVFKGDEDAPKDEESAKAWKDLGIEDDRIIYLGKEHNWWPTSKIDPETGKYKNAVGLCGPDTEMFYWIGEGEPEDTPETNPLWVEIWNDVFMQFERKENGDLEELSQKNVDTGMGFERTLAVLNNKKSAYETDLYEGIIQRLEEQLGEKYGEHEEIDKNLRIIADHIKAATFLIKSGIVPSNKLQGYILRRLLRRAAVKLHQIKEGSLEVLSKLIDPVIDVYEGTGYFETGDWDPIRKVVLDEVKKFEQTLKKGLKEIEKIKEINGKLAFDLYQSYGFPVELTREIFNQRGQEIDQNEFMREFNKHQDLSRTAAQGSFKGGLAGHSEVEIKYHTATHLLHQALRDVLGPEVFQKGSNITVERLRFDYSFDKKPSSEELKKVEEILNQKIQEDLKVDRKFMSPEEAHKLNAIGLFNDKYAKEVSIYCIGPNYNLDENAKDRRDRGGYYSAEFCGGPHVDKTGVIGGIKIIKEEAVSSGVRRIYAELV